jgi:hypothetical protein
MSVISISVSFVIISGGILDAIQGWSRQTIRATTHAGRDEQNRISLR